MSHGRDRLVSALLLITALALVGWAYMPALSGDFLFDDQPNLSGLVDMEAEGAALDFVLSGSAGPLGRPIALASFLVHRDAWPETPGEFIGTNVTIHLLNGGLVAWLLLLLGALGSNRIRDTYAAVIGAALWCALPILASTSLMIVQRMTSLSATFVLLGLIGYLAARRHLEGRPALALTGMTASLALFTLLAVLTKENGALLPVFALVVESTLGTPPGSIRRQVWRAWSGAFLWLPLILILGFLCTQLPYSADTVLTRGFTGWERLLTQALILWEYLLHAFLPLDTGSFGPFQTGHWVASSLYETIALAAVAGWLAAAALAFRFRQRAPMMAFALAWYLGGHLLESTVVPLELYFEHRNYVPLIGPCFALAWLAVRVPARLRPFTVVAAAGYFGLLALTLMFVTALWGQPFQAAKAQYAKNPQSPRTVGYLFAHLYAMGAFQPANRLLDRAIEDGINPDRYRASKLYLACRHGTDTFQPPDVRSLERDLAAAGFDKQLAHALYVLALTSTQMDCSIATPPNIDRLLDALLRNPVYLDHNDSMHWTYRAKGIIAEASGDRVSANRNFRKALTNAYDPALLERLVDRHLEAGDIGKACRLIGEYRNRNPWDPADWVHRRITTQQILERIHEARPMPSGLTCPATRATP